MRDLLRRPQLLATTFSSDHITKRFDTPSAELRCSMTSICSLEITDTLSSCFRTNDDRKSARRVSFSKDIESVRTIENCRLSLAISEKQVRSKKSDKDAFLEQALIHCFCEPDKKSKKNDNKTKRQRSKSRRTSEQKQKQQKQLLFEQMLSFPSQKPRSSSELKNSSTAESSKSPHKGIKLKLGLPPASDWRPKRKIKFFAITRRSTITARSCC